MKINRREAITWVGAAAVASCVLPAAGDDYRVVIPGVDRYRVLEPMYEAVRIVLAQRGEHYSPAYVQGVSGAAFRIAGPCPCAPTCAGAMTVEALIRLFGYECETVAWSKEMDTKAWLHTAVSRIKEELRAGRSAIVFHAFTAAEWDVVCGYSETKGEFYGRGSYAGLKEYAEADEGRTATSMDICGIIGPTLIRNKSGRFDAHKAELGALKEAVRFATSTNRTMPYYGLQCYDKWIERFSGKSPQTPNFPTDGYTSGIYASCRASAEAFLREIAPKYPMAQMPLQTAGAYFTKEARLLAEFRELLFPSTKAKSSDSTLSARNRNERAVNLLCDARMEYLAGIGELEKALTIIT